MLADRLAGKRGAVFPIRTGVDQQLENAAEVLAHLRRDNASGVVLTGLGVDNGTYFARLAHRLHQRIAVVAVGRIRIRAQLDHPREEAERLIRLLFCVLPDEAVNIRSVPLEAPRVPEGGVHAVEQDGVEGVIAHSGA